MKKPALIGDRVVCRKCGSALPWTLEFFKHDNSRIGGISQPCKKCLIRAVKEWGLKNPTKLKLQQKKASHRYYLKRKNWNKERCAIWRRKNPDKWNGYSRNYRKTSAYTKWKLKHVDRIRMYYRNREKRSKNAKDNRFLASRLRSRISAFVKKGHSQSRISLIGCSLDQLRRHIEKQFQPGMTWENYCLMGWHFDHKKPCCSFDLSKPEERKACFHFTNLQPLWAFDNHSKSASDKRMRIYHL